MRAVALSTIVLLGIVRAQAPVTDPGAFRLSVNVDLVVVNATVRDSRGRFAPELRQENFEVYEDGVPQSIRLFQHEDVPVTVGVVVDHSGSMRPKMAEVIAGARAFVRYSNPEDEMFVVNFNERVTAGLRFTNQSDELAAAIGSAPVTGKTALYDAVALAQERVRGGAREKKVLVVISDGGDNASAHTLVQVLKAAAQSDTAIYTVGIFSGEDEDRNPDVLRQLARATGGDAYFPEALTDVVAVCEGIAHDIRNQYTLGYVSANPAENGGTRAIRVVAKAAKRKLTVRARSGYMAGRNPKTAEAK
jgi:Ca-activated chloride channel homolog